MSIVQYRHNSSQPKHRSLIQQSSISIRYNSNHSPVIVHSIHGVHLSFIPVYRSPSISDHSSRSNRFFNRSNRSSIIPFMVWFPILRTYIRSKSVTRSGNCKLCVFRFILLFRMRKTWDLCIIQTANFLIFYIDTLLATKISNALNFVQKSISYFTYFPL